MTDIVTVPPLTMTSAGPQPQSPTSLNAQLIALATQLSPGLTADLPGSLIEDISSTDTAALAMIDQARADLINSLSPFAANPSLLTQLGAIYGVQQGVGSNTSVYVVFTGPAGYVITQGFTVSDGTNQYIVQDGGIIGSGGTSLPLFCVAVLPGTWAVPQNTVKQLITSVPSTIALTVNNPNAGTPGLASQSEQAYRAQVLQAGLATSQGMATHLKTLLQNVSGVQPNLISVQQGASGGWRVICGGGDPYQTAYAIYSALFDISTLIGSQLAITGMTNANPVVISTNLNHGYTAGQTVTVTGATPSAYNVTYTVASATATTITTTTNGSGFGAYVSGATLSPNPRNVTVSINDYPDQYQVVFVNPPQQTVSITVTWNTISTNFISPAAIAQLAQQPLANYVNGIAVGQPMNLFELQNVFQSAVSAVIPPQLLTRMVFQVIINGVIVAPGTGTGVIAGDPESYFYTTTANITVNQG
ncbi:baseplate J/gp47 family protein [Paraburkholderia sp. BR10872]|uniref:baseplate J/gp47 family protein n=1 Tax=Paraburkholderia sp. BR10872 TaxID=3236989 RepID=UPI0034D1EAFC